MLVVAFAVLPFVRAVAMWRSGWVLYGDNANIAIQSPDVGTRHTPILGMPSGLVSLVPGSDATHPGPLIFWAIGPWERVFGLHTLSVLTGAAFVGSASSVAILWAGRRLAGRRGLVAAAAMLTSIVVLTPYDMVQPLNPVVALLPALAALLAAVLVATGDDRAAPVLVVAGAFAAQADVAYTILIAVVSVVSILVRIWRRHSVSAMATDRAPTPTTLRGWTVAAVLLVASWSGPLIDVVVHRGGNVAGTLADLRQADLEPQGWSAVLAAIRGMSTPLFPAWAAITEPRTPYGILSVVGLSVLGLAAWRGTRRASKSAGAIAVVGGAAVGATLLGQALTPEAAGRQTPYLFPVVVTGALLWFFAVTVFLMERAPRRPGRNRLAIRSLVVIVALVPITVRIALEGGNSEPGAESIPHLTAQIRRNVSPRPVVLYGVGGPTSQLVLKGVGFYLEGDGFQPKYSPDQVNYVGRSRTASLDDPRLDLLLATRPIRGRVPTSWKLVAHVRPPVDETRLRSLRHDVAESVRRSDLVFTHQAASSQIGQVVTSSEVMDGSVLLDDQATIRLGQRYLDDPARLRGLSDLTLATLVEEGIVQDGGLDSEQRLAFKTITEDDDLDIWLIPTTARR